MTGPSFARLVQVELRKLLSRGAGQAGLALSAALAAMTVLGMQGIELAQAPPPGVDPSQAYLVTFHAADALGRALQARNFFVLPLVLLLLSAQSLGGELADRTLRDVLVRPVSRATAFLARLAALAAWSGLSLLVVYVVALLGGVALLGPPDAWSALLAPSGGYLVAWTTDLGLIALGMAASMLVASAASAVVAAVVYLVADAALRLALAGAGFLGVAGAAEVAPFLASAALASSEGMWTTYDPVSLTGLAVWTAIYLAVAGGRFIRTDVP